MGDRKDDEELMNNFALFCFLYAEEFEHNHLNELISNFFSLETNEKQERYVSGNYYNHCNNRSNDFFS